MAAGQLNKVVEHVRSVLVTQDVLGLADSDLLNRYVRHKDEAAFEALLRRHGPMVMGVCRRVLHSSHDAADAFQATFLVLVRKASTLRNPGLLGNWLYGVAYRTALEARKAAAKRRAKEAKMVPQTETPTDDWADLRPVLDQELERLPEKYRAVLVLCDLEGKTRKEAARQLGCPEGTVASRLATARSTLAKRLARYGLAISGGTLATLLSQNASACVPAAVLSSAIEAATVFARGTTATAGIVSTKVAALTEGVLKTLLLNKLKAVMAVLLLLAVAGGGLALVSRSSQAADPVQASGTPAREIVQKQPTDRYGDPLPAGALARLGTVRLRHSGGIWSLAFSPDGKRVVSGGNDQTARLWDAATGKELRRFAGNAPFFKSVAFTPDGKTVVTGGYGGFRVWDTVTGAEIPFPNRGRRNGGAGYCVAVSADGKTLVSANQNVIQVWDLARRQKLRVIDGPASAIEALALSPDGKLIATAGTDRNRDIRLWEATTGKAVQVLKGHEDDVLAVAFSPDGKTLASGSQDKTIRLWDVVTGKEVRRLSGHESWVECVAFSPDGKLLASGSRDSTVRLWDVPRGKEVRSPLLARDPVIALAFSPDGKTLVTGGLNRLRVWDVVTGRECGPSAASSGPGHSAVFLPDGKTLISGGGEGVSFWDAATGRELRRLNGPQDCFGFALSSDGTLLAVCDGKDSPIRLFSVTTGKEIRWRAGHKVGVWAVAFAPDGKTVASADYDDTIRLWDVAGGKELRQFKGNEGSFNHVAFSPDGRTLAAASGDPNGDRTLRLWDVRTGKQRHSIRLETSGAFSLAFSPDGTMLATVGGLARMPGEVRLWDVATGKERRRLEGHTEQVGCVAFSPDGRTLVTGSGDRTIRFWEVATGKERRQLRGHENWIGSVAFSPDGRRLVSTSHDTTGLVWDVTGHIRGGRLEVLKLSTKELEARWADLAGEDAAKAYRAVWDLVAGANQSVPFLRAQLKAVTAVDAKQIARWISDLDSRSFTVRTRATRELEKLADLAEPALRKLVASQPSVETRRRAEQLLQGLSGLSAERLRIVRAIEALEHTASPDARQLLATLAAGAPAALQTREAKAALQRLATRP